MVTTKIAVTLAVFAAAFGLHWTHNGEPVVGWIASLLLLGSAIIFIWF